jgi:hypothetical protein
VPGLRCCITSAVEEGGRAELIRRTRDGELRIYFVPGKRGLEYVCAVMSPGGVYPCGITRRLLCRKR